MKVIAAHLLRTSLAYSITQIHAFSTLPDTSNNILLNFIELGQESLQALAEMITLQIQLDTRIRSNQ